MGCRECRTLKTAHSESWTSIAIRSEAAIWGRPLSGNEVGAPNPLDFYRRMHVVLDCVKQVASDINVRVTFIVGRHRFGNQARANQVMVNTKIIHAGFGIFGILLGVFYYAACRDSRPDSIDLVIGDLFLRPSCVEAGMLSSFPTLAHAFSFTMLFSLFVESRAKSIILCAAFWFAVNSVFEIASSSFISNYLWLSPGLGTFDGYDILGAFLGAFLAFCLLFISVSQNSKEPEIQHTTR